MNDCVEMVLARRPGFRLLSGACCTLLALMLFWLAPQGAAFAAGEHWIRFTGNYTKVNARHPLGGLSNTESLQVSNPEDNVANHNGAFRAAEDLVFDRLVYTQWDLPLDDGNVSDSADGDQCLYARSYDFDPGPSELLCIPTYTTTVATLTAGDPEAEGHLGVRRVVDFPTSGGLFFPKGSIFTCPNHLNRTAGATFSLAQLSNARWSCRIEYHLAAANERVGRIARIPYLDSMLTPGPDGQLFDPSMIWVRGWDGLEPLVITGFLVYASTLGVQPGTDKTRNYQDVCINKVDALTRQLLRRVCVPDFSYSSNRNAPNSGTPMGFIELPRPMELSANERLTASCRTLENASTDCAFFVLYEVPPDRRVPTIGDYYWDLGQFDANMIAYNGLYCEEKNLDMLTPAGKQILRAVARFHGGQWADANCAEDDFACSCRELYKPFVNSVGN